MQKMVCYLLPLFYAASDWSHLIKDFDRSSAWGAKATRTAGSNAENPSKSRGPYRGYGLATFVALLIERLDAQVL